MTNLTIKHVGYGPSGVAAYVVTNRRGKTVKADDGRFLFDRSQADALVAKLGSRS